MSEENKSMPLHYRVGNIEKTEAPEQDSGTEWYSYTIEHETSSISGKRPGSLRSVTKYLEEYVEKLNGRPNLGYSAYSSRKEKK